MKAKERILRYGIVSYRKMIESRGRVAKPVSYYVAKYPGAKIKLPVPTKGKLSVIKLRYWKNIRRIKEGHEVGTTEARRIHKRERAKGDAVRIIRRGEGWQMWMLGLYRDTKPISEPQKKMFDIKEEEEKEMDGWSMLRHEKDYYQSIADCIRDAQGALGGSNWELIKVIKEKWYRYYGWAKGIKENVS